MEIENSVRKLETDIGIQSRIDVRPVFDGGKSVSDASWVVVKHSVIATSHDCEDS